MYTSRLLSHALLGIRFATSPTLSLSDTSSGHALDPSTFTNIWIVLNILPSNFTLASSRPGCLLCFVLLFTVTLSVLTSTTLLPPSSPSFLTSCSCVLHPFSSLPLSPLLSSSLSLSFLSSPPSTCSSFSPCCRLSLFLLPCPLFFSLLDLFLALFFFFLSPFLSLPCPMLLASVRLPRACDLFFNVAITTASQA